MLDDPVVAAAAAVNERLFNRFDAFMLAKLGLLVLVDVEELGVCEARLSLVRVRIDDELLGDNDCNTIIIKKLISEYKVNEKTFTGVLNGA